MLVLACYAGALLLWAGSSLMLYWYDSQAPSFTLDIQNARLEDLEQGGSSYLYNATSGDPQIIFEDLNVTVRRVVLYADFSQNPGEMDLYFTRREGQGFSPRRRVWGYLQDDGSYGYTLPSGTVSALRIDPGTFAGPLALSGVEINPRQPLAAYFALPLNRVLLLAIGPAFAAAVVCTIIELTQLALPKLKALRKKETSEP